jgi:phytoene dehydrogenase-like protein
MHSCAGGNLTGWQRGNYHIDNCIHWLTGTNPATPTYKTWEKLGALGGVKTNTGESLYTCEHNGQMLSLYSDLGRLKSEMLKISPKDTRRINSLFRAVEIMQRIIGIDGIGQNKGLLAKDIFMLPMLAEYYFLSVGELASKFSHPLLRTFIRAFWGDHFGALALICVIANFCGGIGGLPDGGSKPMAERMAARFIALGGKLETGRRAVKINVRDGRAVSVELADGEVASADYIIYTGDLFAAFGKLIPLPLPRKLKKLYASPRFKVFSSYQCAFSCSADLPFTGDYIFNLHGGAQVILREFSLEKSFAPKGETLLQTMTFCKEEECRRIIRLRDNDKSAYKREKSRYAQTQERLIVRHFPQLKGKLKLIDVWTPATYKRYTGAAAGSYMSFTFPSHALPSKMSGKVKGADNLILATQWQQSPGGLPIAAECGQRAAMLIARKEKSSLRAPLPLPQNATAKQ